MRTITHPPTAEAVVLVDRLVDVLKDLHRLTRGRVVTMMTLEASDALEAGRSVIADAGFVVSEATRRLVDAFGDDIIDGEIDDGLSLALLGIAGVRKVHDVRRGVLR